MLGAALGVLGIGATKALTEYTKNKKKATTTTPKSTVTNKVTGTSAYKNPDFGQRTYADEKQVSLGGGGSVNYSQQRADAKNGTAWVPGVGEIKVTIENGKVQETNLPAGTIVNTAGGQYKITGANTGGYTSEKYDGDYTFKGASSGGGGGGGGYDYTKAPTVNKGLPEMNLPDYEKFKYDDFNYGKEFSYDDFNYKDFNYNADEDPIYKQYADMYARQGQSASEQALANTAAATGGMASSYAAAANAQAQQAYAKKTADMVPVLENQAYGRHTDERNFSYQDYLNDRSLEYDKHYNDKNFSYQDYINNRNLALGEHQNKYGFDRDNALSEYNADWQNINYSDSRNDLEYDRKYQQEQFDYQKYLNDLDENYRQDTFDWNKTTDERDYNRGVYADDRNYNYNSGQDAIRNSISWANQGLSKDKFEYDKTQDELARQDREEQAKREKYQQDSDVNYPNTVMGQLEERTRQAQEEEKTNNIRAVVSSALQSPNPAEWLKQNAMYLNEDEYASVIKILKDYGTISKQGE